MEHGRLLLTIWYLAIYLMTQSKTNIAALAPKRHLGVLWKVAWLLKHKLMEVMVQRPEGLPFRHKLYHWENEFGHSWGGTESMQDFSTAAPPWCKMMHLVQGATNMAIKSKRTMMELMAEPKMARVPIIFLPDLYAMLERIAKDKKAPRFARYDRLRVPRPQRGQLHKWRLLVQTYGLCARPAAEVARQILVAEIDGERGAWTVRAPQRLG